MAPDRGDRERLLDNVEDDALEPQHSITNEPIGQEPDIDFLARQSEQPQCTFRALAVGTLIGILIAFSNTYFGLQTGWISGMAMPSALIGFAYFKGLRTMSRAIGGRIESLGLGRDFSEVENVLVQTVAGSVGTMPLGCGFVGVVPALEFLLKPSETPPEAVYHAGTQELDTPTGGIHLTLAHLIIWSLGLCFFGVMFAVPLRKEVIIREKLKFPSGTATALMIGVLHGGKKTGAEGEVERHAKSGRRKAREPGTDGDEEAQGLISSGAQPGRSEDDMDPIVRTESRTEKQEKDWQQQIRLLTTSFGVSGAYTLISYFLPQLHSIPFLGLHLSEKWVWNLNPSPAYVGQGIIMGPATTIHMFLGAVLGWAVLSPIAKYKGWAPGPVDDWNTGSKGWIVWVSLAIMLADAIVSLGWLVLRPTICCAILPHQLCPATAQSTCQRIQATDVASLRDTNKKRSFCILAVQYSFAGIISIGLTVFALLLAMILSIMGVRALGETDLNPVSGISKLTQLIFAAVVPATAKNAITINLIAGGISEAGALQAGDLLQDLKCGHLLGASPKAQFWGQLIGSGVGAIVSACIYRLYTNVYTIPGGQFQIPTGYVWIFTARLVTGSGLPPKTLEFAIAAAIIWSLLTALRIYGQGKKAWWTSYIPGGIAVAVGMYNTPSFTLARTVGGLMAWYWTIWKKREETPMIVLASGLILGEGLLSIVNLGLASAKVPHL
ncbi:hypothetical protein BST61_g6882 [Cercospora zeina]